MGKAKRENMVARMVGHRAVALVVENGGPLRAPMFFDAMVVLLVLEFDISIPRAMKAVHDAILSERDRLKRASA
jgi:hypothetical protein